MSKRTIFWIISVLIIVTLMSLAIPRAFEPRPVLRSKYLTSLFQKALKTYSDQYDGLYPYSPNGEKAALYLLRDYLPSDVKTDRFRWFPQYDEVSKEMLHSPFQYLNPPGGDISDLSSGTIILAENNSGEIPFRHVVYAGGGQGTVPEEDLPQIRIVGIDHHLVGSEFLRFHSDALSVIHSRKSVRTYTNQPVTDEKLETLVRAAMAAPTAMNKQPWSFIIVTDPELCDALGDASPGASMCKDAPAVIVVCGIPEQSMPGEYNICWTLDCSAATQNLLLAAEALHLGAVWTAVYPSSENIENVRKILDIPENVVPFASVPVGHPAGDDKPKNKYKPEKIHHQKWGQPQN